MLGGAVVGWSDDRRFGGPVNGEILFDKIYFLPEGRRVQVGTVRRVGFELTELYETLSGTPVLAGSVRKDGSIFRADGSEAGKVSQDVWSEMTSNTSGAACALLAADPAFLARALAPGGQGNAPSVQVPEQKNSAACREDHAFGAAAQDTQPPAPVPLPLDVPARAEEGTPAAAEEVSGQSGGEDAGGETRSEGTLPGEVTAEEQPEEQSEEHPEEQAEAPAPPVSGEYAPRMPVAEEVFSYGTPKPGKRPRFKPAAGEEPEKSSPSKTIRTVIGVILIIVAGILYLALEFGSCSMRNSGGAEPRTETLRYEYNGCSGGGSFGGGALAGPAKDEGSCFEIYPDGSFYGEVRLSAPTVDAVCRGSCDGEFSDPDVRAYGKDRPAVRYRGETFHPETYFGLKE